MDISEFSRTETLKSNLKDYLNDVKEGKRQKSITYEIVRRDKLDFTKGSRLTYYITGSGIANGMLFNKGKQAVEWQAENPDQNIDFYLKRLDEFTQKFRPFFKDSDYSKIFTADELFGFSPEGIEIQKEIQHKDTADIGDDVPF